MSWNYRLVRHYAGSESFVQIHEVYYDRFGKPNGISIEAVSPFGEDLSEFQDVLNMFQAACEKPILEFKDFENAKYSRQTIKATEPHPKD